MSLFRRRRSRRSAFDEYSLRRLILRDYLAVERTRLANERTFLAYFRTVLAMTAGAVTLLHFFNTTASRVTGWLLIALGLIVFGFGVWRLLRVRRRVEGYARLNLPNEGAPPPADNSAPAG